MEACYSKSACHPTSSCALPSLCLVAQRRLCPCRLGAAPQALPGAAAAAGGGGGGAACGRVLAAAGAAASGQPGVNLGARLCFWRPVALGQLGPGRACEV